MHKTHTHTHKAGLRFVATRVEESGGGIDERVLPIELTGERGEQRVERGREAGIAAQAELSRALEAEVDDGQHARPAGHALVRRVEERLGQQQAFAVERRRPSSRLASLSALLRLSVQLLHSHTLSSHATPKPAPALPPAVCTDFQTGPASRSAARW
jgi:hypothetical protein